MLCFTEEELDCFAWKQIVDLYPFVYLVIGSFNLIEHIQKLSIDLAHKILVLSDQDRQIFCDSQAIYMTKTITDFFNFSDYLVELRDESNIRFLCKNPSFQVESLISEQPRAIQKKMDILRQLARKSSDIAFYYWSSFASGNVYFSSIFTTAIVRQIYEENWMDFLIKLTNPNETSQTKYFENKMINSLVVDQETINYYRFYGLLQVAMMNHQPSLIAFGLVKNLISSLDKVRSMGIDFKKLEFEEIENILFKFGEFKVVLTNPGFFTELEIDDVVIVMGFDPTMKKDAKNQQLIIKYSSKFTTEDQLLLFPPQEGSLSSQKNLTQFQNTQDMYVDSAIKQLVNPDELGGELLPKTGQKLQ